MGAEAQEGLGATVFTNVWLIVRLLGIVSLAPV